MVSCIGDNIIYVCIYFIGLTFGSKNVVLVLGPIVFISINCLFNLIFVHFYRSILFI